MPRYPDRWLRLVAYPTLAFVIRHFGDMTPWGQLLKQPLYYADLLWDMLIVAASWEANRALILYFDRHYSWVTQRFQRFVIQSSTSLIMTLVLVIPMIYIWNEVITDHGGFDTANLLVNDFPLIVIFTSIIHLIYTFWYFNAHYQQQIALLQARVAELEATRPTGTSGAASPPSVTYPDLLVVDLGSSSVPVQTAHIAYVYKENELSFITTFDGKEYTSTDSLETLEDVLDPGSFFRLNRQMIGNVKAIRQFRPDVSGKLLLDLSPAFGEEVTVSKKKAAEFREWISRGI